MNEGIVYFDEADEVVANDDAKDLEDDELEDDENDEDEKDEEDDSEEETV